MSTIMQDDKVPVVSILMTAYNREKYIGLSLDSILASTFSDYEVIIVDDGSTDQTVSIAKRYAAKDNRIFVYQNEQNLGDYPNRNKAASYAKGKYLKYLDSDDIMYPWALELMVKYMEQFPEAGWGLCSINPDKKRPFPFMLTPPEIFEAQNFTDLSIFSKGPVASIIKREVFNSMGQFSGIRHMSDTEMWHQMSMKHSLVLMPHGFMWYREHDDQESTINRTQIKVRTRYQVAALHFYKTQPGIPLSDDNKQKVIKRIRRAMIRLMIVTFLKGKPGDSFAMLSCMNDHRYDFRKLING